MGFGFNLVMFFIILPLTVALLFIWLGSRKNIFGVFVLFIWVGIFSFLTLVSIVKIFTEKKDLERVDIYGEYIIDRTKFSGKQSDWQYDHYRFIIKEDNSIIFYETEKDSILKRHKGTISFHPSYKRPRLILDIDEPRHHIIENEPTLYRTVWSFYYVFNSPKYGNVFFKKGKWEPLDND
ncbi:MAG: hypothetical protein CVV25_03030 [Ignavibacteriae bacterium HGW-Ignavibacteriae-4]|jgi:hypothetical protein|nr:MAG: hypothetical protein CVV25_03030 [Ignavibacteriae bacterium HGW-Ignavibacteriae-4]